MIDSIFPSLNLEIITAKEEVEKVKIGRSFLFNSETKKFEFANGKNVEVGEVEAIKQWIRLILRVYKNEFNVYKETDFNCNIKDLIGQKLNDFIESELKREITESLLKNSSIASVDIFSILQIKRNLNVEFTVTLSNNEVIEFSEVI